MGSNDEDIKDLKIEYVNASFKLSCLRQKRIDAYDELLSKQNHLYKDLPEKLASSIIENIEKEHVYKMSKRDSKKLMEEQNRLSKEIEILEKEKNIIDNGVNESNRRTRDLENAIKETNEEIKQLEEQNILMKEKFNNEIQRAHRMLLSRNMNE